LPRYGRNSAFEVIRAGRKEIIMVRTAVLALAISAAAFAAQAQTAPAAPSAPPDSDETRYTFNRAGEGYLRLDTKTGHVSLCTRRPVGWACQLVPDERAALEAEIARLQGENAALKKDLLANNLPLPKAVKPDQPPPRPQEPLLRMPTDEDFQQVKAFVEKVWRRLVDMIVTIQRDILKRT
jgi:hypothetical protein